MGKGEGAFAWAIGSAGIQRESRDAPIVCSLRRENHLCSGTQVSTDPGKCHLSCCPGPGCQGSWSTEHSWQGGGCVRVLHGPCCSRCRVGPRPLPGPSCLSYPKAPTSSPFPADSNKQKIQECAHPWCHALNARSSPFSPNEELSMLK